MIKTRIIYIEQHAIWTKFDAITAIKRAIIQTTVLSPQKTSFGLGNLCAGDWG